MAGYSATIKDVSKELTAKERIAFKDTTSCIKIDEKSQEGKFVINPAYYGVLEIHNDKSDNGDYENYIIVDKDGSKYVTGSASFWSSFKSIADEMNGVDEEWGIEIYRVDSKNYKGKQFITCTIV